jgi:hypothetical protein
MAAKNLTSRLHLLQLVEQQTAPLYESAMRVMARHEALAILQNRYHLLISECGKPATS